MSLDLSAPDESIGALDAAPAQHSRMHQLFERTCAADPTRVAIDHEGQFVTYGELDMRANQLAQYLRQRGVRPGARVAVFLSRSVSTYVSLLAVGKSGATLVPIDPAAPQDRLAYIVADAGVSAVVTSSELAMTAAGSQSMLVELDTEATDIANCSTMSPELPTTGPDDVAYVMYTSGSSGRPKGVMVTQDSICNFLSVVPDVYDVRPDDRVYQGMTISFDFSIEEIWPTWVKGATIVVGPTDSRRLGGELADFLEERSVNVLYCVPTLLATLPRELPGIRSVLVGGEACPAQLVNRWSQPGRRMLNTYGPTEATVTATVGELLPGRSVTIGRPLPTYSVVLLDEQRRQVPDGDIGEICIGGPGVALGYVGRPELTADRFIDHELAPPGSRLYRTGDLGRINADGEIEYHGRADAEVKIRGHRIDLGEVESVLLEDPAIAEAVVTAVATVEGAAAETLAAFVVRATDLDEMELVQRLHERMRHKLPPYMVAATVDVLPELPTMPSGKVDRKRLPAPVGPRFAGTGPVVPAENESEQRVVEAWSQTLDVPVGSLSVEADFFRDLGGHSLLAARTVSRLRESGFVSAALRDLYQHPTVRALARYLFNASPAGVATRPAPLRHPTWVVGMAGCFQVVVLYLLFFVITVPVAYVYTVNDGYASVEVLVQLMAAILITYVAVRWFLPLLFVRLLSMGIRPGRYPLWGITYLRIWTASMLLAVAPLPVLSGSPLAPGYLRWLGAKIGNGVHLGTSALAMPSMLRIADGAAVGYGATLRPWRLQDGWVLVDHITIGAGAYVGAHAVLDPGATLEAGAAVGEQSMLVAGATVPMDERWAGSPAASVQALTPGVEQLLRTKPSGTSWPARLLATVFIGLAALELAVIAMIAPTVVAVWAVLLQWGILAGLLVTLLAGPIFVMTVCVIVAVGKRLVLPRLSAGIYRECSGLGVRKWVSDKLLEISLSFTNSLYATLYTVPWLRLLGAKIGRGSEISTAGHLDPNLLQLDEETFIADMASVGAAAFARGYLAVGPTVVGRRSFIGNAAVVPAGATIGENCLLGVATVPPTDGVPSGTSWLGSPAINLPARQDSGNFSEAQTYRPPKKLVRHRLAVEFVRATLPASLLGISTYMFLWVLSEIARGRDLLIPALLSPLIAAACAAAVIGYCAAVKNNLIGVYENRVEPLWSKYVRRAELVTGLYEAAAVPVGLGLLIGTPFLPPTLRWFGARIGRRTWIGTTYITEFDLVDIGDDASVGVEASLQTHLFEDRVMKMSKVTIRSGASVGNRAIVLYDSIVDCDVALDSLSLLMKGEHLAVGTHWGGIPAQHRGDTAAVAAVRRRSRWRRTRRHRDGDTAPGDRGGHRRRRRRMWSMNRGDPDAPRDLSSVRNCCTTTSGERGRL
jgi:non-ribosomal peptide synthetase-like protein